MPGVVRSALALSQLTAVLKPNGKVRGIAAGDTLRRLVEKTLAKQFVAAFQEEVAPHNFGLASRCGTDALVHLLRASTDLDENCTILSIDGVGAYDHVSRGRMFQELWRVPALHPLIPYVRMFLGHDTEFVWRDAQGEAHSVQQGEGGEQGSALMPALFCLALKPALDEIQSQLQPGERVYAYLDDIYVVTSPARVRSCYNLFSEVLDRICHIQVNRGKLVAWNRSGLPAPAEVRELDTAASETCPAHTVWTADLQPSLCGVTVLDAPIGSSAFVESFSLQLLDDEVAFLTKLQDFPTQHAWLLLSFCGAPRASYRLRTIPPRQCLAYTQGHDTAVLGAFCQLLGVEQPTGDCLAHWTRQLRLPFRCGGLGLRSAERTSRPAYWASWGDCLQPLLQRFPDTGQQLLGLLEAGVESGAPPCIAEAIAAAEHLDALQFRRPSWRSLAQGARAEAPDSDDVEPGEWRHGWQFEASNAVEQQEFSSLLSVFRSQARSPHAARLLSSSGRWASAWLTVCPTSPALTLSSADFTAALRLRLGLRIPRQDASVFCEGCNCRLDDFGYHRLTCMRTGRVHARHFTLVRAWRQVLVEAGAFIPRRNIERMLRNTSMPVPADDARRVDLVAPGTGVAGVLPLFCDVTCVSPVTGNGLASGGCLETAGGAVRRAQRT